MADTITKFIPYEGQERDALEGWLEDMARQGFLLESIWLGVAKFKKVEPCQIRYRIDPQQGGNLEKNKARRLQLKELGWEYVTLLNGALYKTADPTVEFPPVTGKGSKHSPTNRGIDAVLGTIVFLLFVIRPSFTRSFPVDWTVVVDSGRLFLMLSSAFLIIAICLSFLMQLISTTQLHRREKRGELPNRSFHTRKRAKRCMVGKGAIAACYLAVFLFLACAGLSIYSHDIPLDRYGGTIPFPLLEEINSTEWQELLLDKDNYANGGFSENYLMKDANFLAPKILMTRQNGPSVLGEDGYYRSKSAYGVNYYELASKTIAQKVTANLEKEYPYKLITASPELKAMYVRQVEEQHLLLHDKNIVISVWYSGSTDLRDCIPLYEKYLKQLMTAAL